MKQQRDGSCYRREAEQKSTALVELEREGQESLDLQVNKLAL
jgi:hypothetical protein